LAETIRRSLLVIPVIALLASGAIGPGSTAPTEHPPPRPSERKSAAAD
jgi:hypothetical protein